MRPSVLTAVLFLLLLGGLACSVGEERSNLQIQSNPAGAWLYLDGQLTGETPYLVQSPLGVHQVRLVYPGYMPW
ncbi:MAG: PEGA domain-containing protein, partial [Chloroflexota bacterium]